MDTGTGHFEILNGFDEESAAQRLRDMFKKYPEHGGVFTIGEIVELKGSRFKVRSIGRKGIRLKLLKKPAPKK